MNSEMRLVIRVAALVRREVLKLANTGMYSIFFPDLGGGCAVASVLLWRCMNRLGAEAGRVVKGHYGTQYGCHCWYEYKGVIYDCTATQFGLVEKVNVTYDGDPDYNVHGGFNDYKKMMAYFGAEWLSDQSPTEHVKFMVDAELRVLDTLSLKYGYDFRETSADF